MLQTDSPFREVPTTERGPFLLQEDVAFPRGSRSVGGVVVQLVLATFNLRTETGQDGPNAWPLRRERAAAMMRVMHADVVGTQEGSRAMVGDLLEHLDGYRAMGRSRTEQDRDEQCALFYRTAMATPEEIGHFWLSEVPEVPGSISWDSSLPRMCTWVRFRLWSTSRITVYNTHLDHRGATARRQGIALIGSRLAERCRQDGVPAALVGDLNAGEDSDVVRYLRKESGLVDAFSAALDPVGATFHGFTGTRDGSPIDYIFVTPDIRVRHIDVRREQIAGGYPSDHFPVCAMLEVP